jgi:hypothetical protein
MASLFENLYNFFGFRIKLKNQEEKVKNYSAVVPSDIDEGTNIMRNSNFFQYALNTDVSFVNQEDLIRKYREMSLYSEIESAIDEIVNEVFYIGDNSSPIEIVLDKLPYNEQIKEVIKKEFDYILSLLNFTENSYELFRRWYIDGRLYFNVVIDKTKPQEGIKELRYIDPRRIQKVREPKEEKKISSLSIATEYDEYYILDGNIKLSTDMVVGVTSGLTIEDKNKNSIAISYLHKAIKPFNQLRLMEDATVIYRVARAPERRVFKINFGNLPKAKINQEMNDLMNKFRNKIVYDSQTGEIKDDTRTLSMLEDFWIPVYDDGKSTDISTLPGGQNLGEMEDVKYFLNKLYKSLYIPTSRIVSGESSPVLQTRATEIQREELKFMKFIHRLRNRFASLFTKILRIQLLLKNVITEEDWNEIKNNIFYNYKMDSHFSEYNEAEIMTRRIELAGAAINLGENYFSKKYIQKKFLKLTDEVIKEIEMDLITEKGGTPPQEEPRSPISDMGFGGGEFGSPEPEISGNFQPRNMEPEPEQQPESEPTTPSPETTGETPPPEQKTPEI